MSTAPASMTNADLGARLGLAHSTISRMRRGERTGSVETLTRISELSGTKLEAVVAAAAQAKSGDLRVWLGILDSVR